MDFTNDTQFIELAFDVSLNILLIMYISDVIYDIVKKSFNIIIIISLFSLLTYGIYVKFLYFLPTVFPLSIITIWIIYVLTHLGIIKN